MAGTRNGRAVGLKQENMVLLHGTWLPTGRFFVWAEEPDASKTRRKAPDAAPWHPRLVAPARLGELGLVGAEAVHPVALPTLEGAPLMPLALAAAGAPAPESRPEPSSWSILGLELAPLDALLTLTGFGEAPGLRFGDDWRLWQKVGLLTLELLGRERFVPALSLTGDAPRAYWKILTNERADAERLAALAIAMPPLCRHFQNPPAEPRALLVSALDAMADAAIRAWAPDVGALEQATPASPGQRWFGGLMNPRDNACDMEPVEVVMIAQHLNAWTQPLMPPPEAPFRTAFRLEAPVEGAPPGAPWRLEFTLQASDDPSVIIPALQVWRGSGNEAGFLARRFDRPQERLLEDLARASKIFRPITRELASSHPEALDLSTEEAYEFLRQAAPMLEEAGYGVMVPPWWRKGQARLGVQVTLTDEPGKPGALGHEALVAYDWGLALGDERISKEEFEQLVAMKQPLLKVRGRWVELDPTQIADILAFYESRRSGRMTLHEAMQLATVPEGQANGLPIVSVQAEGALGVFLKNLAPGDWMGAAAAPEGFNGTLRPYQERGYGWLTAMRERGLGACLADDMGLGKTIQLLALLLAAKDQPQPAYGSPERRPWLLICPTSVVGNWRREAEHFAPGLRVMIHHGASRAKAERFADAARRHDVVISTYALLFRDEAELAGVSWAGVVFDEAQNVKNAGSKQAQAARRIPADWRVALTGTPVENRLEDLWSLMDLLNPGYLGTQAQFRKLFAAPIEKLKDAQAGARLRALVQPFLLRRVKTDPTIIQDLPEKNEQNVFCPLTREQATMYQAIVSEMVSKIEDATGIARKGLVLASLTKLKQITDHPALFLGDGSDLGGRSGKLARLAEMLDEVAAVGDRALVFTQFAEMGHLLVKHLGRAMGREIPFLHGGVSASAREKMVRDFQERPDAAPVLILSLKAGGVGLNLTRANHVFHYDRWWNPAVEAQATDRAFRIGQTKSVMVHKFLCLGTLEEKIDQLIESKKALSAMVVGEGEGWLTELSTEQLRDVLALREEAIAVE